MEIMTTSRKRIEFIRKIPFRRLDNREDFEVLAFDDRGIICHYRKEDLVLEGVEL